MAPKHGTRRRYNEGCRCADCKAASAAYQANYRQRRANGQQTSAQMAVLPESVDAGPGRVEAAIQAEICGLAFTKERPGLTETALALARLLDDSHAQSQKPAAAGKLVEILDKLHKGSGNRRSQLASVRQMTRSTG